MNISLRTILSKIKKLIELEVEKLSNHTRIIVQIWIKILPLIAQKESENSTGALFYVHKQVISLVFVKGKHKI